MLKRVILLLSLPFHILESSLADYSSRGHQQESLIEKEPPDSIKRINNELTPFISVKKSGDHYDNCPTRFCKCTTGGVCACMSLPVGAATIIAGCALALMNVIFCIPCLCRGKK